MRITLCLALWFALFAAAMGFRPAIADDGGAARWLSYYKGEGSFSYESVAGFIKRNPDFPGMRRLREAAEKAMPDNLPDADAIAWFSQNPPETTFGMRTYAGALKRAGREAEARAKVNEWWRKTLLPPADQSKAFMAFASILDKSAHQERLRHLIYKQQYTNARAVAEALGPGYIALTEARIALRSGKGNADYYLKKIPAALMNDEGLLFDRLQFRRKAENNAGAIEILNKQPSYDKLYDAEDWGKERGIIVRRLFEEGKYAMAYRLASTHRLEGTPGYAINEWMAGWIALEFQKKPWQAFEHFERMYHKVETPISKSRAAFWAGLSSERLGHPEVAQRWYNVGAQHSTSFYGQLAGEKLGRPLKVSGSSATASAAMKNGALARAAKWLRANGYKTEATMFFNAMMDKAKTPGDFTAIADIAIAANMKNVAIRAAQECEKKTGVILTGYAFPKVERYMRDDSVEWALVHALIRQESRYDTEAVSSAGARGLMQLMPATAKEVARKAGIQHDSKWLTSKPQHNIILGKRYLRELLNRYDGNYAMALAAYNAGPSRVNRWIGEFGDPRNPKVNLVHWIEMIPIYETRNYVQRVLESVYVYRQTLSSNKGKEDGGIRLALQ